MTSPGENQPASEELARCRDEIASIDREIISLLRKRVDIGLRTGVLKREMGLPILDPTREAAVIRTVVESARAQSLPDEPVREIFWRILGLSRSAQQSEEK
jgi:chorismate mutase